MKEIQMRGTTEHTVELLKLMKQKYDFKGINVLEYKDGAEIQLSMTPEEMTVFLAIIRQDAVAAHVVEELHAEVIEEKDTPDDQA